MLYEFRPASEASDDIKQRFSRCVNAMHLSSLAHSSRQSLKLRCDSCSAALTAATPTSTRNCVPCAVLTHPYLWNDAKVKEARAKVKIDSKQREDPWKMKDDGTHFLDIGAPPGAGPRALAPSRSGQGRAPAVPRPAPQELAHEGNEHVRQKGVPKK